MREGVIKRYALRWIDRKHFVEEILELSNFAHLLFGKVLIRNEFLLEITDRLNDLNNDDLILWTKMFELVSQEFSLSLPVQLVCQPRATRSFRLSQSGFL